MTRVRTALIIGGGIAGPVSAMALQKTGIESTVFEARPSGAGGVGVFLTLASNGIDALRVLDADGPALATGFATPAISLRSTTGKPLGETRTGGSGPDATPSRTIKRAELYRALHDEAERRGVRIQHGKRLVSAEETGDGVRATFADGSEALGDVLIGCDGIHSTVRKIIDPRSPEPVYSGLITNGGYVRGVPVDTQPGTYEMIFGKHAFFGYAVAPDREVWWFANLPHPREPARGEVEAIPGEEWRRRLIQVYADDAGPAIPLIEATSDVTAMSPIHVIPHLPKWHNNRAIVIGDAAHAPSPTSGQGASLSIEDAVMLARCLRDQATPRGAFEQFEAERRPRVERIIKWAARINNSKTAGPVGRVFRDAMLPVILRLTANNKALRESYDYHIDWNTILDARA
jgi:2-polyprenyl-6-methoxyphenol hydroxylase-like FAD-dependent oxidoreductase